MTKLKILQNSKNKNVIKHQNSKCDKTQNVTKLRMWQNSECDKTKKFKMWQKKTQNMTKLKNSKCQATLAKFRYIDWPIVSIVTSGKTSL